MNVNEHMNEYNLLTIYYICLIFILPIGLLFVANGNVYVGSLTVALNFLCLFFINKKIDVIVKIKRHPILLFLFPILLAFTIGYLKLNNLNMPIIFIAIALFFLIDIILNKNIIKK